MNVLTDGVDAANAALAEIGLPQVAYRLAGGGIAAPMGRMYHRAIILGFIAEHGQQALVRCLNCAPDWSCGPCTPARDALRGVTCRDGDQD